MFDVVARIAVDAHRARVYEHGWQSGSPTAVYPVNATSYRPVGRAIDTMAYRPAHPAPARGFQGEGLLAVDAGDTGSVRIFAAPDTVTVPSIRASYVDGVVTVSADGPVTDETVVGSLGSGLASWADRFASAAVATPPREAPTGWCTWYQYFTEVTEGDVVENLTAIVEADLPIDVVQIDDGWQAEIGDWTRYSDRFASLPELASRIRDTGRRAGIWVSPFLVGARSQLVREHPEWLIGGGAPVDAGHNWGEDLFGLDTTHPGAARYLRDAFAGLVELGFDYFKLDFLYAGALEGQRADGSAPLSAYRDGLRLIRDAVGPMSYVVASGAPILPSIGLVDAMRVSADIAPGYEAPDGDPSRPSQFGATLSTVARSFQHGRFWVNDSDCLIVRPAVERREEWAAVVEQYGGLRVSSDRISDLDWWGLDTTRRLLANVPPPTPFDMVA